MAKASDVSGVAERVCRAFAQGDEFIVISGTHFNLKETGYCAKFVRQCHEVAMGLPEFAWVYSSRNAWEMERKLRLDKRIADKPRQRGDIVGLSTYGSPGHVGIVIDGLHFAENTVSPERGPGFVISKFTDVPGRVTDFYSVLPYNDGVRVFLASQNDEIIWCNPVEDKGVIRCDLRTLAESLGCEVNADYYPKIYIKLK